MQQSPEQIVDEIFALYDKHGSADYIGESISQIEHMCQSAQLAQKEGYDDEVILAAFFHDLGHLLHPEDEDHSMGGYGMKNHEGLGADYLRSKGFSERVAVLVESHVQAKRYLTYKDTNYYSALSEASKKTLQYQGGVMSADEAQQFEANPYFAQIIKMRLWDEAAKEVNVPLPDLAYYKSIALKLLQQQ